MDFSTSFPIYLQIINGFKRKAAVGELVPGQKIPSQRELAAELKVNVNTVQRAYREMENLGLVRTLRGQGTYMTEDESLVGQLRTEMLKNVVNDFLAAMAALGYGDEDILELVRTGMRQKNGGEVR
ncbi:MAG: GntR family transcriptional regulator [Firmicutes bacterium]|nr:GntR family transcriptional regulator [Bacillota bacterium]